VLDHLDVIIRWWSCFNSSIIKIILSRVFLVSRLDGQQKFNENILHIFLIRKNKEHHFTNLQIVVIKDYVALNLEPFEILNL